MMRGFIIAVVGLLGVFMAGCPGSENEPVLEDIKIGDLAPYDNNQPSQPKLLDTINFEIHIFEIPAENVDKLEKIQNQLFIQPLRLTNYPAFTGNSFSVRFGRFEMFNETVARLLDVEANKVVNASLMLTDSQEQTVSIIGLRGPRTILFTGESGKTEGANVPTGVLGLRMKANRIPGTAGVCNLIVTPVFSPLARSSIPTLDNRVKLREFIFTPTAFGSRMNPGDYIMFSPTEYIDDGESLCSMIFSNPQGSLFVGKGSTKPPEIKPAVRVFLFLCTRIDD